MSRKSRSAILSMFVGILGLIMAITPLGLDLEESIGLEALFHMRGERKPPAEAVVLRIDRETADHLDVPSEVDQWPRSIHTKLVQNLTRAQVAVTAFDIFFYKSNSAYEDGLLADAIVNASNVVLCEAVVKDAIPMPRGLGKQTENLVAERLLIPFPKLAQSAIGLAPFPLPKVPVRVSQYWTFREMKPTLPVVAFQVFTLNLYPEFLHLLGQANPMAASRLPSAESVANAKSGVENLASAIRALFVEDRSIGPKMMYALNKPNNSSTGLTEKQVKLLRSLICMYEGPDSRILNLYGPPGAITTIPYHCVLKIENSSAGGCQSCDLKGKAVFIGVSGNRPVEKPDGFYTVFSQPSGADISGVEIAAAAFANILENVHIQPLSMVWHLSLVLLWGTVLGTICFLFPTLVSAIFIVVLAAAYVFVSHLCFARAAVWPPIAVPLLIQAPLAFVGAVLWKYVDAIKERRNIRNAFGFYLPVSVVDALAKDLTSIRAYSRLVYGTCLCTDGDSYSTLSETMHPRALTSFLNRYYDTVFRPVRGHGGMVSDIVGDSMMAVWTGARDDMISRMQACLAALEIDEAISRFNASASGRLRLPTRIGLHSGQMSLANIGGVDHYEFRPVGDAINTASRIENVNKHFRTRILASGEVTKDLNSLLSREVGTFILAGKSRPLVLHEIICLAERADDQQKLLCTTFSEGLHAYRKGNWDEAVRCFLEVEAIYGTDGPSEFYIKLCRDFMAAAPASGWDGMIHLDKK